MQGLSGEGYCLYTLFSIRTALGCYAAGLTAAANGTGLIHSHRIQGAAQLGSTLVPVAQKKNAKKSEIKNRKSKNQIKKKSVSGWGSLACHAI